MTLNGCSNTSCLVTFRNFAAVTFPDWLVVLSNGQELCAWNHFQTKRTTMVHTVWRLIGNPAFLPHGPNPLHLLQSLNSWWLHKLYMVGTLDRIFFHTQYCFHSSLLQPAWCSGQTNSSRGNLVTGSLATGSPCQILVQWWKELLKPGLPKGNVEDGLPQLWNKNQALGNKELVGGSLGQANMRSTFWITSIQINTRQAWQPNWMPVPERET